MKRLLIGITFLLVITWIAEPVRGHQQTERYIPIGASSAETVAGRVQSHSEDPHQLTLATDQGVETVVVSDRTNIWIDRSMHKTTNLEGTYADCALGRHIEVKFLQTPDGTIADWIKVRAE